MVCWVCGVGLRVKPDETARIVGKQSIEAMDAERLAQLQELMKEARQNGQLERALLQSSVLPVPSPPSRRNIPLNEYQQMMATLPKQGPVHVSEMALTIPEDVKIAAMSQMEQPGCRPKAFRPANSAMAQVAALGPYRVKGRFAFVALHSRVRVRHVFFSSVCSQFVIRFDVLSFILR